MIYLFSFEGLREIEESRYRLPQKLIVQSFEEGFLLQGRMEYLFEQPEDYEIFSGDIDPDRAGKVAAGDGGRPLRYGRNTQTGVFRRKAIGVCFCQ